jgi:RNA polymerase sigma-70 factor (ECF subfamily)
LVSRTQPDVDRDAARESPAAEGVPADDDPEALVSALRNGEAGAAGELFDRYSVGIHRVLVRIIGSDDPESSDLLHDTFLRALDHIGELRRPRALKSWLKGIAVFTAQEWVRARRRMGQPQAPESRSERAGVSPTPEVREAIRSFYTVMDQFPEDERAAFVLRFVDGMELGEVADACGVSLSTARRRIRRAEQRFLAMLPLFPPLQERLKVGK